MINISEYMEAICLESGSEHRGVVERSALFVYAGSTSPDQRVRLLPPDRIPTRDWQYDSVSSGVYN